MNSETTLPGSYQASISSDQRELAYLERTRPLGWIRLVLAFITFGAAVAVIGCEAVPLRHYQNTSVYEQAWLALWPLNFDLRPTIALLACGSIIALQNLIYIIVAVLPSPHSRIRFLNLLAGATGLSGFITALVGFVFKIYLPSSSYPTGFTKQETLHSWTCKWKSIHSTTTQAPIHFERDCTETQAAFVLTGCLIGLEVIMGLVVLVGLWLERTIIKQRGLGFDLERVKIASKNSGF